MQRLDFRVLLKGAWATQGLQDDASPAADVSPSICFICWIASVSKRCFSDLLTPSKGVMSPTIAAQGSHDIHEVQ